MDSNPSLRCIRVESQKRSVDFGAQVTGAERDVLHKFCDLQLSEKRSRKSFSVCMCCTEKGTPRQRAIALPACASIYFSKGLYIVHATATSRLMSITISA